MELCCTISVATDSAHYAGPYSVVPSEDAQTLATSGLLMDEDVAVAAIPTYRVANAAGGDTFTIGELSG